MRALLWSLVVLITAISAEPEVGGRIVGGSATTINAYPFAAAILYGPNMLTFWQQCGGTILNNRHILTAAHCLVERPLITIRTRVGSTWANSGGTVHNIFLTFHHVNYNRLTLDYDIAMIRTPGYIVFIANTVQPAAIAGSNYNLLDNQLVTAIGWGKTTYNGSVSEQLRTVPVWTVNQATCRQRYLEVGWNVTDNMLCAGWIDIGTRGQCDQDEGGPLLHNNVVVGIYAFSHMCGQPRYPAVNTRISRFTTWILANLDY